MIDLLTEAITSLAQSGQHSGCEERRKEITQYTKVLNNCIAQNQPVLDPETIVVANPADPFDPFNL
jgi:hypothetical protein